MQRTTAAFSQCDRIEFWYDKERNEPPVIILVFSTQDGLIKSKSREVYNELLDKLDFKTTFFKIVEQNNRAFISFVDGVSDIHLTVKNLKYSPGQLNDFLKKVDKNGPFAFLLGLDNNKDRPIIVPTKDKFEIMTLAGFIK